jgi:hypothetical protein
VNIRADTGISVSSGRHQTWGLGELQKDNRADVLWLESYPEFGHHLQARSRCVLRANGVVVFYLRS